MIRRPAVAGQFYPGSRESLLKALDTLIDKAVKREEALGAVSPHAGYIYSGPVAGSVLAAMRSKPIYIIMGPNHTGLGEIFSLSTSEAWKTPLGDVSVNLNLAEHIKQNSRHIKGDDLAHSHEHSIEVQLPFLQALQKDFTFVPIVISHGDLDTYRDIGRELAKSIKELKLEKDIAIIASSDMTHYEPQRIAQDKDSKAITAMLELDEAKLIETIDEFDISMCGYAPTAVMLVAAKELGAKSARLVKYQTSGDASGDYSSVVGYAGVLVT